MAGQRAALFIFTDAPALVAFTATILGGIAGMGEQADRA